MIYFSINIAAFHVHWRMLTELNAVQQFSIA